MSRSLAHDTQLPQSYSMPSSLASCIQAAGVTPASEEGTGKPALQHRGCGCGSRNREGELAFAEGAAEQSQPCETSRINKLPRAKPRSHWLPLKARSGESAEVAFLLAPRL